MRFTILGAGGVGAYYGALLARAGHDVTLLARGAHLEAIRSRGLEVRTPEGTFVQPIAATDDPGALPPADVAILAVKTYALAEIAGVARHLAEAGATIVPFLNGVEAVDRLAESGTPAERILGGLTEISAARLGPGVVARHSPFQRVAVGEMGRASSERAERIAEAFRGAGVEARVSLDMPTDLWRKLAFISTVAAACGLARAPIGPVREAPLGRLLLERALREALAVGTARGAAFSEDVEARLMAFIEGLPGATKPSFLLDLEAGGPTELEHLSGAVSRLGRLAGVPTPVHDVAAAALSVRR